MTLIAGLKQKYRREYLMISAILIWVIFYFTLNELTRFRQTHFPVFGFEKHIPFLPQFLIIYFSLYILAVLPYFFIKDQELFKKFINAFIAITLISSAIYLIYPVEGIRPIITHPQTIFEQMYLGLVQIARPYNLMPSLHVSVSFLAAFSCGLVSKKIGWLFGFWAFLIALSTLFVKQHYLLDIVTGFLLSWLVFKIIFKLNYDQH